MNGDGEISYDFWMFFIAMIFAGLSWIGRMLRDLQTDQPFSIGKAMGGLIGAFLGGYSVASVMFHYTDAPPEIIWTICIFAGLVGEKATYLMLGNVLKRGIPFLELNGNVKEETDAPNCRRMRGKD